MSKTVSLGIFLIAAAVTSIFFINFCATVFQCGCQSLWGAAAKMCNIHHARMHGGKGCPWCTLWEHELRDRLWNDAGDAGRVRVHAAPDLGSAPRSRATGFPVERRNPCYRTGHLDRILELMPIAVFTQLADTVTPMGDDATFVLFILVVLWLAISYDGGGGGGRRARIPVGF